MIDFPIFVYRSGGDCPGYGCLYSYKPVFNYEELEKLELDGWTKYLPWEKPLEVDHEDKEFKDELRIELEEKAKLLNIKFSKRTSDDKLIELIAAAE